jgi:2-methylisocitrate lyase-like PEP mutase family enzyme
MTFLERLAQPGPVLCPGVYDALSALLAQSAGFEALYLSGASISYALLGRPDIGMVSATEVIEVVTRVRERVTLPIIVDADTGFGNMINVQRSVRGLERAGATVIQLEDLVFPKPPHGLRARALVPVAEMVGKVRAACDARDTALIMGRTYATSGEGLSAAMDRAEAYLEAGADILFIEAPGSAEGDALLGERFLGRAPLLFNMVEGGVAAAPSVEALGRQGYRLLIYPSGLLRAFARTALDFLAGLKATGSTAAFRDRMLDARGLNQLLQGEALLAQAESYR